MRRRGASPGRAAARNELAQADARNGCKASFAEIRPDPSRSRATTNPKMNPPTWAKNAVPPPFALAEKRPKLASNSWNRNQPPRKSQAGILIGQTKTRVRIREFG